MGVDVRPEQQRTCPVNGCRLIHGPTGVVYRRIREDALHWTCPVCKENWHRFPPGNPWRERAVLYVGHA